MLEQVRAVGLERGPVVAQELVERRVMLVAHDLGEQLFDRHDEGGSLMMLRWPSTTWVSLSSAFMLSLVRALVTALSTVLAMRWASLALALPACAWSTASSGLHLDGEYQTSRFDMAASWRISSR